MNFLTSSGLFCLVGAWRLELVSLHRLEQGVALAGGTVLEVSVLPDKQFTTTRARFLLVGVTSSVVEGLLGEINGIIPSIPLWTAWQVVANSH